MGGETDLHNINAAKLLEGSIECLVDRAGVGDIEVNSQEVAVICPFELQLRAVSRCSYDLVALLQGMLDHLVAEASRRSGDKENLWCHGCGV